MRRVLGAFLVVAAAGGCGGGSGGGDAGGEGAGGAGGQGAGAAEGAALLPEKTEFDDVATARKCDPDDESQNCLEPGPNTIRVDDEVRLAFKSVEVDKDAGIVTVELQDGATLDPRFKEGAFIYRGRKDKRPLLHRIEGIKQEGSKVAMKLSPAKAKEAFPRARVRVRVPLGSDGQPQGMNGAQAIGGDVGSIAQALSLPPIGPKDCSGNVINTTFNAPTLSGNMSLDFTECRFVLTAWVDAVLRWDSFANVDKLEVTVGGSVDAALHAKLTASLSAAAGSSKTIWTTPDIPVTIGGLVLTITPKIEAGWDLTGKATLTAEQGFDYTGSIEEGFGWSDRKGWYSIDQKTSSFTQFGPTVTFDGSVTATAWVRPRVDVQAFGIVGGYVALKCFAEGAITSTGKTTGTTVSGNICTDLSVGLTPTVGASADVFGIKLFDENVELVTLRTKLVDDACFPYTGAIPSDCDTSSPCCTDGQCPQSSDPGVTVQCEKGPLVSAGKYKYECKNIYPDDWCLTGSAAAGDAVCDDGSAASQDVCEDNHCVHTVLGVDTPEYQAGGEMTVSSKCFTEGCCFTSSDCADGDPGTTDACAKVPSDAGPEVKGTCKAILVALPRWRSEVHPHPW